MNRALLALSPLLIGLPGCAPLVGGWEGEVRCNGESLDVLIDLEWDGREYVGDGALNCGPYWGAACVQKFEVHVQPEEGPFAGDLDVDVDDCHAETADGTMDLGCDNPDDVEWDGGDHIEGEWSGCELELDRE